MGKSICIFFSDTGGGHRSAAEAIACGISELIAADHVKDVPEIILENVAEHSHPINQLFVDLYNYLLRYHEAQMKYYAWFVELTSPNDSAIGYFLAKPYLVKLLEKCNPKLIVSVHPMINHYLARIIKEMGLNIKLIIVVTDPNKVLWSGWACKDADLTIVPNDLALSTILAMGIDPNRVVTLGMPIHPNFFHPHTVSREKFLDLLALVPERLTVAINAGWGGCDDIIKVYASLAKTGKAVQCIILTGHNEELFERMKVEVKTSTMPTAVLPFHENMSELMAYCDLMVTKAGGLTTFEALAQRLPLVINLMTEPMPQERGTADLLIEEKLAWPLYKPEDIIPIIQNLTPGQRLTLPAVHQLDHVDAIYDIARTIVKACDGVSMMTTTATFKALL